MDIKPHLRKYNVRYDVWMTEYPPGIRNTHSAIFYFIAKSIILFFNEMNSETKNSVCIYTGKKDVLFLLLKIKYKKN